MKALLLALSATWEISRERCHVWKCLSEKGRVRWVTVEALAWDSASMNRCSGARSQRSTPPSPFWHPNLPRLRLLLSSALRPLVRLFFGPKRRKSCRVEGALARIQAPCDRAFPTPTVLLAARFGSRWFFTDAGKGAVIFVLSRNFPRTGTLRRRTCIFGSHVLKWGILLREPRGGPCPLVSPQTDSRRPGFLPRFGPSCSGRQIGT